MWNGQKIECSTLYRIGKESRRPCRIHHAERLAMGIPSDAADPAAFAEYVASALTLSIFDVTR